MLRMPSAIGGGTVMNKSCSFSVAADCTPSATSSADLRLTPTYPMLTPSVLFRECDHAKPKSLGTKIPVVSSLYPTVSESPECHGDCCCTYACERQ
jgi:hypothetical protein